MVASAFFSRSICTHSSTFSSVIIWVRLITIVDACSTWLLKNSPEVLEIDLCFLTVNNCDSSVNLNICLIFDTLDCFYNIRKLSNS